MSQYKIENVNIVSQSVLPSPEDVHSVLPLSLDQEARIFGFRSDIRSILDGSDRRLMVIAGPCSIHNTESSLEYARRLKALSDETNDVFLLIMRVYFEKPRTSTGWKGLINDPYLDDSFRVDEGLRRARQFLLDLAEIGLPAGTEALDPVTPQYTGDLISWTAIGARTTESQTHREMASGLSTPVAFKNSMDGSIDAAINGIKAASGPHHFLGISGRGECAVFHTAGNSYAHIILRGGNQPNYTQENIAVCADKLKTAGLKQNIVIDCSHGNSGKDYRKQPQVFSESIDLVAGGTRSIVGLMLESNLKEGSQSMAGAPDGLDPDISITDACIGWETTEALIRDAASKLRSVIRNQD